MKTDPQTGIRILDATLDYSDTSEDRVLDTLRTVADRSSGSDELAGYMVDWPTRYHFSRMRGHLVRPLDLGPHHDVLEVGCGTGAVTRAIGERGCRVLGIEGALPRARAAALRCADLDNVEIACGDISHLETDRTFDLVCLVGVLEYAAAAEGGRHGPEALLAHIRKLVKPDGTILVAIENQIGLKYLLGYREDHVGLPWAGVEDYGEGFGARTWSRRQLGHLLTSAGFPAHRWLFPFPDYKLPSAIVSEDAFNLGDSTQVVDQLVGRPVHDFAFPRTVLTDDRRVHRVLLDAGLGPEIANSFLVLASADERHLQGLVDRRTLAWILGGERRHIWKRTQVLTQYDDDLRITARANSGDPGRRSEEWLAQLPDRDDPWHRGPTLEQLALDACHQRDEAALSVTLNQWMQALKEVQTTGRPAHSGHPFAAEFDSPCLPTDMLDVSPSNFVATDHGIEFVDREWHVQGGVDPVLAGLRALWFFALDLVHGGARHPWSDDLSVDQICAKMAELCGMPSDPGDLDRMYDAEAKLQSLVIGFDQDRVTRDLRESGRATIATPNAACPTRWTHLHEFMEQLGSGREAEEERQAPAKNNDELIDLQREINILREQNSRLERLLPVRIYSRLKWWFSGG